MKWLFDSYKIYSKDIAHILSLIIVTYWLILLELFLGESCLIGYQLYTFSLYGEY